ncbi:hypothetical protein SGL43_06722 [Streptomyces globisporus]|uniref:Uncharacterized protein n=1 Tax=Streptomyces globisporus TaxID=1908 RepID=A0ABM9H7P3_STRGL|nr:hypothetical protein SGL43_06722 [Streptomyces globisporus]
MLHGHSSFTGCTRGWGMRRTPARSLGSICGGMSSGAVVK